MPKNILGNDAADQQAKLGRNKWKVDIIVRLSTHKKILNKIDEIILLEWQANGMQGMYKQQKAKCYKEIAPMVLNKMKFASKSRKRNI